MRPLGLEEVTEPIFFSDNRHTKHVIQLPGSIFLLEASEPQSYSVASIIGNQTNDNLACSLEL